MKQVAAALLFTASLVNGQGLPADPAATATTAPVSTEPPLAAATAAAAAEPLASSTSTTLAPEPAAAAGAGAAAAVSSSTTTLAPEPLAGAAAAATPVSSSTTTLAPEPLAGAGAAAASSTTTLAPEAAAVPAEPTPYVNPYCPAGKVLEVLGRPSNPTLPMGFSASHQAECRSNVPGNAMSMARDFEGRLICDSWACCLCQEISCGASGLPCEQIKFSDKAAIGVQNINVIGQQSLYGGVYGGSFGFGDGAQIDCNGLEACKRAKVRGQFVRKMQCSGDFGCEGADIRLEATQEMDFQCNGMMSCMNAQVAIVIPANSFTSELGTIEFNGQQSAQGMTLTLINEGPNPVNIRNLECMNPTSCPNINIVIQGNFWIENCDLQGIQTLNSLPAIVRQCALHQHGHFQQGFYPQQMYPLPQQTFVPPQQTQTLPASPAVTQTPPAAAANTLPAAPVANTPPAAGAAAPAPAAGAGAAPALLPAMSLSSQSLKCITNNCANRQITVVPANNFVLECLGSCAGMDLTLNAGLDPMNMGQYVERIDSLKFITPGSGNNAIIRINTAPGMFGLEVNDIRCEGWNSCTGMKVFLGPGVDAMQLNMDCNHFGSCAQCTVTQNGMEQPCELYTGNSHFIGYPYGQTITAPAPGAGAAPAAPAHNAYPYPYGYPGYI